MPRLTIKYDGDYAPKELCSIDRTGEADDCLSCREICEDEDGLCETCPIQKCFNKLALYEAIGEPEEFVKTVERKRRIGHAKRI